MKWTFIGAVALAAACMTTACSESGGLVQPSSLPSSQPSSVAPSAQQSADGPSVCTNLEPCPGGVEAGPPPELSCSMVTSGIDVVVRGARQSDGTVSASVVGQVPPGTQPAPPGDEVTAPPGTGDVFSVAKGDALGRVASVQGGCPDLTFTVGGTPVVTNASTRYFGLPSPPPPRS